MPSKWGVYCVHFDLEHAVELWSRCMCVCVMLNSWCEFNHQKFKLVCHLTSCIQNHYTYKEPRPSFWNNLKHTITIVLMTVCKNLFMHHNSLTTKSWCKIYSLTLQICKHSCSVPMYSILLELKMGVSSSSSWLTSFVGCKHKNVCGWP